MRRSSPSVYSECCNMGPVFNEPTTCCGCFLEATFYDPSDTMTLEEYQREKMTNNDSKFDIDLKYGQIREQLFADIMEGKEQVEVKTERGMWKTTGNIAIEWMSRGKLSGIATTEAYWWAHFLADEDLCNRLTEIELNEEDRHKPLVFPVIDNRRRNLTVDTPYPKPISKVKKVVANLRRLVDATT